MISCLSRQGVAFRKQAACFQLETLLGVPFSHVFKAQPLHTMQQTAHAIWAGRPGEQAFFSQYMNCVTAHQLELMASGNKL